MFQLQKVFACMLHRTRESFSTSFEEETECVFCSLFKLNGFVGVSQERKLNGGVAFGGGAGAGAVASLCLFWFSGFGRLLGDGVSFS